MSDQGDSSSSMSQLSEEQRELLREHLNRPDADASALLNALAATLPPAAWKNVVAETAATALPAEEQPDLVASVVQGLGTDQQKQAAAGAAVDALSSDAKPDLVASVVQGLGTSQQKQAAAGAAMGALSQADMEAVAANAGVLDLPDTKTQRNLWYMVVGTMALAIFAFGIMAFLLLSWGKGAEAPLALATTALGGIVGLIATSPGRSRRSG
jgi:hypothetical protein